MRYEHRRQPLATRRVYAIRLARSLGVALIIIIASLILGIMGYRITEHLSWVDALLNSSMLLGGMGPVNEMHTVAGKLFASFYALYSGLIFLIVAGVLIAPIVHRFTHSFHLELEEGRVGEEMSL
jgi:hypothetical protein